MAITPSESQIEQLVADAGTDDGEVVMLNLLRFAATAGDGGGGSGQDAYARYGAKVITMVEERGGRVLWMGSPDQVVVGDVDADAWDAVALVRYPNRAAFIDMVTQPSYSDAHEHREGGLERTVLLAMTPAPGFAGADA